MINKYEFGMQGQQDAEKFLQAKGYRILKRNYRIQTGEVDLIARDGDYIIFIEVKYRSGVGYGYPRESVGKAKQRRIIKTAMHYIAVNDLDNQDFRFDVIEVLGYDGRVEINHIENAFDAW
ncbi:MAG: YraN family protein [Firmicutes bacterium]|nr:YraN family protein [Bacillota bacterium]